MHSYLITGLRMGPLMKLLQKHGFKPTPRNVGGLLFVLQNAFWASFFSWREKKIYHDKITSWPVPEDPVIIIGHWRTGSTFLHLMLSQDRQFVAPTLFQAAFPDCFLTAEKYYRPIMTRLIRKRPMDNVRLAFDDAQEDEFALMKLTLDSPLWEIVFPQKKGYFIQHFQDFIPSEDPVHWKGQMLTFSKKVVQGSGRTLLLKNPMHSLRIPLLMELFPNARFIHIHRHPYKVVASSMNLWKQMTRDNQLTGKHLFPSAGEVTGGLAKFYRIIERDLEKVPGGRKSIVAYETLEKDPIGEIGRIYSELGLGFSPEAMDGVRAFLDQEKDFTKNSYKFDENDKAIVYRGMKEYFDRYRYSKSI